MINLSDVVKNDVIKKTVYDKLVAKVNNIDTNDFVLKTNNNTDKTELEKEVPNIRNLATKTALTAVESKIPNFSNLVKKKQTTALKLQILKVNLIIIIMTNILIHQNIIFSCCF